MSIEMFEHGATWQVRYVMDRRFWMTSGGWPHAISYGVTDDFGDIVSTEARPLDMEWLR